MTTHILRVVVRGFFDGLTDAQRAELAEQAPAHDIFRSAYTAAGTLTYDERLVAFSYRFEVRVRSGDGGEVEGAAEARAVAEARGLELAAADLVGRGLGWKRLRATVTDMANTWT